MKQYRTKQPIGKGGKTYKTGSIIELDEKQAKALAWCIVEIPETMQSFTEILPDVETPGDEIQNDSEVPDFEVPEVEVIKVEIPEESKFPINKFKKKRGKK